MTDPAGPSLTLLGVGMITVFIVLLLVVLAGNGLIWFVNKFVPVPQQETTPPFGTLDPRKVAVITVAVEIATEGKGAVKKIEKLNP